MPDVDTRGPTAAIPTEHEKRTAMRSTSGLSATIGAQGVTSAVTEIRDAMTIARGSTNGMSVAIGIAIESEAGS